MQFILKQERRGCYCHKGIPPRVSLNAAHARLQKTILAEPCQTACWGNQSLDLARSLETASSFWSGKGQVQVHLSQASVFWT